VKSFVLSSRCFRSSREKTEQKRKRKNGPGRTLLEASKLSLRLFSSLASLLRPPALKKERRNRKCKRNGSCLLGWFWKCMEDRPMVDRRPTFVKPPPPLTVVSKRLPPPHSRYKEARTLLSSLSSSSPRTALVLARVSCCCLFFFSSDL